MEVADYTDFPAHEVAKALRAGLTTPLGEIADGRSLSEIATSDRLAELNFEMPVAVHHPGATIADIAELLDRYLSADDPLRGYSDHLRASDVDARALRGYLTGSIDAVVSVNGRFLVLDYKTNRLGGSPLTLRDYTLPAMTRAMVASHYPLQAMIYAVALHRCLRARLDDYGPERHLGGVGYLFVRGMAGPNTPVRYGTPCGVFPWTPDPRLITALSDLMSGVCDDAA
jgi:exodeoxyribonuclease V beta subunit